MLNHLMLAGNCMHWNIVSLSLSLSLSLSMWILTTISMNRRTHLYLTQKLINIICPKSSCRPRWTKNQVFVSVYFWSFQTKLICAKIIHLVFNTFNLFMTLSTHSHLPVFVPLQALWTFLLESDVIGKKSKSIFSLWRHCIVLALS